MTQIEAIRKEARRHVAHFLNHYRKVDRGWMRQHGKQLLYLLKTAIGDVCSLEEGAITHNLPGGFWDTFEKGLHMSGFTKALECIANLKRDQRRSRGMKKAVGTDDFDAEFWLFTIREKLREGWTTADVLKFYAEEIERCFRSLTIWQKLARTVLNERGQPTREELVRRAFLPLALWEEIDVGEKVLRLRRAFDVCKANGANLPAWGVDKWGKPAPKQITKLIADTLHDFGYQKRHYYKARNDL